MYPKAAAIAWLGIGLAALPALHALDWQDRSIKVDIAPLQTEIEVRFAFVNRSERPVAIRAIRPNCDCLEAAADKAIYAPGESGAIKAVFTVGDRTGAYDRLIMVETDEEDQPVRLSVRIEVPAAAEIVPRMLEWARGADPQGKAAVISVAPGLAIEFDQATATSAEFTSRLETIEPGRRYRLTVTPTSTAAPANAAIRVRGKNQAGQEIVISAYGNVR